MPSATNTALTFYSITPYRISDTRNAVGLLGGPTLIAGVARDFPILSSNCGLASSAQAYSLNFTAIPESGWIGFLSTWPTGDIQPVVSTLNAPTGAVTANSAIVSAGSNGDASVFVSNNSDLVIDVNGYFAPAGNGALHLHTVSPCRLLDTRSTGSNQPFINALAVPVAGWCNVPSSASAVVVNATAIPNAGLGYLTLWPAGVTQPLASNLNADDGAITSNLAIVPMVNGTIDVFASDTTQLILDVSGYFAP